MHRCHFCFVSQPVDSQQAMARRESLVNLQNFKKQYVRRRWKVRAALGRDPGSRQGPCSLQGLPGPSTFSRSGGFALTPQLSFSIVSLCNHLTRSLMKKVHLRPDEDLVGTCSALCLSRIQG